MSLNSAQKATYLRTLPAVRDRCSKVFDLAKQGKLDYFDYHPEKEADVADFCVEIIKVRSHLHLAKGVDGLHFFIF